MFNKYISVFGLFNFSLLNIFLFFAAFFGTFIFWRRLHQNANYKEYEIFDAFLLALLIGFLGGRLVFIILNWPSFGWNPLSWLNIFQLPGLAVVFAVIFSGFSFKFFLSRQKITKLEIMDYWAQATCFGMIIYQLGLFFIGESTGFITARPLGIHFNQLTVKTHPVQLYAVVFYFLLYLFLNYLENNYRTYDWYRGNRSSADTGFLLFIFLIFASLYSLVNLSFQPAQFYWQNYAFDWIIYLILFLFGLILLLRHSAFHVNKHKS